MDPDGGERAAGRKDEEEMLDVTMGKRVHGKTDREWFRDGRGLEGKMGSVGYFFSKHEHS